MKLQFLNKVTDKIALPLTSERFRALISDQWVNYKVEKCRQFLAVGNKEDYTKVKQSLPAIMWCGWNEEGQRVADKLTPTQLFMIDIDHCKLPVLDVWHIVEERLQPSGSRLHAELAFAHVTPSGKGLRLVFLAKDEMLSSLKAHMDKQVELLGLREFGDYDEACKDFSRLSFVVPEEDWLFIDWKIFDEEIIYTPIQTANYEEGQSQKPHAGAEAKNEQRDGKVWHKGAIPTDEELTEEQRALRDHSTYRGTLLREIVEAYINEHGDVAEGERHSFYNQLVKHFRNLCNNDAAVLHAVLPRYGLPAEETEKQCKGLTKSNNSYRHEKNFYWWLVNNKYLPRAEEMTDAELIQQINEEKEEEIVPVPKVLPPVFREFVATRSADFAWPTIYALLPIMGTLTTYLRSEYIDHEDLSTTFYSLIYAPPGMGKSFCKPFEQKMFEQIKVRDTIATMREQIYLKTKKADDSASKDPHVMVRKMALKTSETEFLQKMHDNKERHMFTFAEEVDSFIKGTKAGGGDKTDMLRIAWDNGEYSQSFKSANSFKGTVRMYYNVLMTGTPDQIKKAFPNIENGMITRVNFCKLANQEFATFNIPKRLGAPQLNVINKFLKRCDEKTYKEAVNFSVEEAEEVDEKEFDKEVPWKYTYRSFEKVDLSWLWPTIKKWLERKRQESLLAQDYAKDCFRRRVGRMGASLALLCYACWDNVGKKEQDIIRDFVLAFMEKDLAERLRLYGVKYNELQNESAKDVANNSKNQPILYNELPDVFDKADVIAKATKFGIYSPVRAIVSHWKTEGLVEKVEKNKWRKCKRK